MCAHVCARVRVLRTGQDEPPGQTSRGLHLESKTGILKVIIKCDKGFSGYPYNTMSVEQLSLLLTVCGRKERKEGGKEGGRKVGSKAGRVDRGVRQAGHGQGSHKSVLRRHHRELTSA